MCRHLVGAGTSALGGRASVARLVTAVVLETHDEWAVAERRYLSEESMAKLYTEPPAETSIEEALVAVTA